MTRCKNDYLGGELRPNRSIVYHRPVTNGGHSKQSCYQEVLCQHDHRYPVAPDKTKWTKFTEQMIAFAGTPFNLGDSNISKISAPVLIISGDNDGLDKIELIKTYKLLGGAVSADLGTMPKSQLAIVPSQSHVSLMMQTTTILTCLNSFLK